MTDTLVLVLTVIPAMIVGHIGGWIVGTAVHKVWWKWRNPEHPPLCRCWMRSHLEPYCPRKDSA